MADGSKIEWCDATWNVITGCSVISPGCTNCYAMRLAGTRMKHHSSRAGLTTNSKAGPVWNGQVHFNKFWLDQPLRWKNPRRVFVVAHGDLFYEGVPDEWIDQVFAVMALCPQHTFLVLTKRATRMRDYICTLAGDWMIRLPDATPDSVSEAAHEPYRVTWPLPNVWLGVSVEDQQRADERIPHLLATPAAKRFLSCEPLLGPIDFVTTLAMCQDAPGKRIAVPLGRPLVDWIITGGESGGPGARPMHPEWARSLRDQCAAAGVPFFFKQWGEFAPVPVDESLPGRPRHVGVGDVMLATDGRAQELHSDLGTALEAIATPMRRVGKRAAGRLLDGREWNEVPA